jgi:AcrR family transcriptional regulator
MMGAVMAERAMRAGARSRTPRKRNAEATREALLSAAGDVLARDGAKGLHVTQVARRAGVHRLTAYLYFKTREELLEATTRRASEKLFSAVFGCSTFVPPESTATVSARHMIENLAAFAMESPELCRVWLDEVLGSQRHTSDKFWRSYMSAMERFAASDRAQQGIDVEVHSVLMLAGTFLWPEWVRSQARSAKEGDAMGGRFTSELLRLTFHGVLREDGLT